MPASIVVLTLLASPGAARAQAGDDAALVRELQRAAVRASQAEPEAVARATKRARAAAALPHLRLRVGRGSYLSPSDPYSASDSWRFDVEAAWSLDRLVYDRAEVGLLREGQRLAQRREHLMARVAELYFARQRLRLDEGGNERERAERRLRVAELAAALDGLTDGALSRLEGARGDPR